MMKLKLLIIAFLLPFVASAQKVFFPQQQQAGTAMSSVSDGTYTLSNELLTASFIHADGKLTFGGCAAMGLKASDDLFSIRLGNGTEIASSAMTLNGVNLVTLTPDATAAKASLKLPGKAVEATYTSGDLRLTWRAVLRDGSHYLRTELELTAVADVAMNAVIPMHYTVDNSGNAQAPAVVGNTRGAVIASDKIFAGLETPMGKNSIVGAVSAEPFVYDRWTSSTFSWEPGSDTPQGILDLGFSVGDVTGVQGYLAVLEGGTQTVTFLWTSGSHRLDVAGVDVIDPSTGNVVASDYHKAYTGGARIPIVYTLNIPAAGFYLVRYFRDTVTDAQSNFNSSGTITWSCNIIAPELIFDGNTEANVLPAIVGEDDTSLSDTWTSSSWSAVSAVPAGVTALSNDFTTSNVVKKEKSVSFVSGGVLSATLTYSSGSHRLNIVGVDLLDGEGTVVASDYHIGYTGGAHSNNTYSFSVPAAGDYTLRYLCETKTETITSSGNIAITFATGYPLLAAGGTRTDAWNTNSWSAPAAVPSRIIELGYTSDRIKVMSKNVRFNRSGGTFSATYVYSSGNHGLTIAGVDLIDSDGSEVASDYHQGFSGTAKTDNTYTFTVPTAGSYTIRYYAVLNPDGSDNTSTGNINLSYEKHDYLHLPSPTETEFKGEWSRQTTLASGKTWKVGAVVGLIAPGQARRSFLCYSERERAVPWRPFPMYNSWFELNIDRNNDQNYTGNFNESQCDAVLTQWKTHLFDQYGVGIGSFVWDDGWDIYGTWEFNPNFPNGFQNLSDKAWSMDSHIGAWLGPVGGYGQSGNYRRSYWSSRGGMQLSNPDYYNVFFDRTSYMLNTYHFNFFKFDGISAQFSSVGPDAGATGEENAEGIINIEQELRKVKPDVFLNTTVGTWASPFWFQMTDAVWRQENDWGTIGNQGNTREQWITYRDRLVYQNFVQNSPLCPINCLMTHGFILSNYGGGVANMSRNYADIVREMRCAFACGSGMVEVYADYALMNSINGGKLWGDLAECIKWQKAQEDVLPDVHWVGGNPWDGSKANVYGWAAWNGEKATLALRNPAASAQTFTTTLREALDIPDYVTSLSITLSDAFTQSALSGLTTGTPIDIDATLTLSLAASSVYIYNGVGNGSLTLYNNRDNTSYISNANDGQSRSVTISGRTLIKDGDWNTICLPFAVSAEQIAVSSNPLYGATIMELDATGTYDTNKKTGFDDASGTLYLYFKEATSIEAGKPYIVKWDSDTNISNPEFNGATVTSTAPVTVSAENTGLKTVQFIGTYGPVPLEKDDQSNLILVSGGELGYPNVDNYSVKAFRGYFHVDLGGAANIKAFVVRFGDQDTGVSALRKDDSATGNEAGAWFDLNGLKLSGKPKSNGVYLNQTSKVIIR